jgi:hypothetical protein
MYVGEGVDPQKIRKYALYWEKIDIPKWNLSRIFGRKDGEVIEGLEPLKDSGILLETPICVEEGTAYIDKDGKKREEFLGTLKRIDTTSNEWLGKQAWRASIAQAVANKYNNSSDDTRWTNDYPGFEITFEEDSINKGNRALLQITNVLPIPTENTKIEDIVDFRIKHTNEINDFWRTIEEIYGNVANHVDPESAYRCAEHDMTKALKEVHYKLEKEDIKYGLGNISASLKANPEIPTALLSILGSSFSLAEPIVGSAVSTLANFSQFLGLWYGRGENPDIESPDYVHTEYIRKAVSSGVIRKEDFEIEEA